VKEVEMRSLKMLAALLVLSTMLLPVTVAAQDTQQNILGVAAADPNLSTFVAAVRAAGLECDLMAAGPFTVFAPSNAAFAALPKGTLENLLRPENRERLRTVLTYHVVSGRYLSTDVTRMSLPANVTTLNGQQFTVKAIKNGIMINCAQVTRADVMASNGVIHVIDRVLIPPTLPAAATSAVVCPAGVGAGPQCPQPCPHQCPQPCPQVVQPTPAGVTCPPPCPPEPACPCP
jgi:uncharacterized surface protein with fasciclin (FAS1) repeats